MISVTDLPAVIHPKGNIFHVIKASDNDYMGFGEAYFSTINPGEVKGWKRHSKMTMNLVVPVGAVEFAFSGNLATCGEYEILTLSPNNYKRVHVPPGVWVAFKCVSAEPAVVLNMASIEHDPLEADNVSLSQVAYPELK